MSLNKMEKIWKRTSVRRVAWEGNQEFYSEYIKFETPVRHLSGNIK